MRRTETPPDYTVEIGVTPDGVPVLRGEASDPDIPGMRRVWCRHCRDWHTHGIGAGHRVAHCHVRDSPYRNGGYIIVIPGEAVPDLASPTEESGQLNRKESS